jgi:hypothetical protein
MGKQSRKKNSAGKATPLKGLAQRNSIRKERQICITISDLLKIDASKETIAKNEIMFRLRLGFGNYKPIIQRDENLLEQKKLFIVSILNTLSNKSESPEGSVCGDFCKEPLKEDFNLGDLKDKTTKELVEGLYSLLTSID